MFISVIVVTYNQEATIARTLDSILSQRLDADLEIVVGDDCSTDGTERICRDYASRFPGRITYLRRAANMGVVRNYFDCIGHARGELLADCAGDDFWIDDRKLQKQLDYLMAHPDVTMVATDFMCRDEQTGALTRHPEAPAPVGTEVFGRGDLLVPVLSQKRLIHLCTALYRKAPLMERVAESPDSYVSPAFTTEDLQIVLAASQAGRVAVLPDITLHYSVGHRSISHPDTFARRFRYTMGAMAQTRALQLHFGVPDSAMRAHYRRLLTHLSAMAFRSGRTELRDSLSDFRRGLPFSSGLKGRVYTLMMRRRTLWKAALILIPQLHGK